MKKVLCINDLSGFSNSSLKVNIALMSALGVDPCCFPTAILSAHTGYEYYSFYDFTKHFIEYKNKLRLVCPKFDCIYSGFLSSVEQINLINDLIDEFHSEFVVIDPVMADNGKMYETYTQELCDKMRILVSKADLVTPNITEACILTNTPYKESFSQFELKEIASKIVEIGAKIVIITGIVNKQTVSNFIYKEGIHQVVCMPYNYASFAGTGDVFASCVIALLMHNIPIIRAVELASEYIYLSASYTFEKTKNTLDGIHLYKYMDLLRGAMIYE